MYALVTDKCNLSMLQVSRWHCCVRAAQACACVSLRMTCSHAMQLMVYGQIGCWFIDTEANVDRHTGNYRSALRSLQSVHVHYRKEF